MAVLTDDEREFVIDILTAQVAGNAVPRATLSQLLHESLREQLDVSSLAGNLADKTFEICDYTLAPPALCAILEFLIDRTGDARVSPLLGRLQRRIHVQPGPTQAPCSEPILLVRGDVESGKSYISDLVERRRDSTERPPLHHPSVTSLSR